MKRKTFHFKEAIMKEKTFGVVKPTETGRELEMIGEAYKEMMDVIVKFNLTDSQFQLIFDGVNVRWNVMFKDRG